jgi:uncharacterized beta barrel domain-containing protein DUF5777
MSSIKKLLILVIIFTAVFASADAQKSKWKRSEAPTEPQLDLFHSLMSFSLPTAQTLSANDWHFGLSHRFTTPISEGAGELWGFDGGVIMRLEVGYAPIDNLLLTLGRTNYEGNVDFQGRYKLFELKNDLAPTLIALNGGIAYMGKAIDEPADKAKLWQYYGQVIVNTMFLDKTIGVGIVPSYVYNSNINCDECQYTLALGTYAAYYINDLWSVLAEYTPTLAGWRNYYDSFGLGFQMETGGHFFKFLVSNNYYTNTTQYLGGAPHSFESGDWHFGFYITRTM